MIHQITKWKQRSSTNCLNNTIGWADITVTFLSKKYLSVRPMPRIISVKKSVLTLWSKTEITKEGNNSHEYWDIYILMIKKVTRTRRKNSKQKKESEVRNWILMVRISDPQFVTNFIANIPKCASSNLYATLETAHQDSLMQTLIP